MFFDVYRKQIDFKTERIFVGQRDTLDEAKALGESWAADRHRNDWKWLDNMWCLRWQSSRHGGYVEIENNPWKRLGK